MTHEENDNNADTQQQAWQLIEEHFRNGKPLAMQVVEATPKRWLVELEGVRGIVHGYITHPADVFHRSQEVVVKVESIDESKRVVMSLLEAH